MDNSEISKIEEEIRLLFKKQDYEQAADKLQAYIYQSRLSCYDFMTGLLEESTDSGVKDVLTYLYSVNYV